MTLKRWRQSADARLAELRHARMTRDTERAALSSAAELLYAAVAAQGVLQGVAAAVQTRAHKQIAKVVNRCLGAVFGEGVYGFRIHFPRKRGRTEAKMVFVKNGREINPLVADSGGVLDVASFALRLACLLLGPAGRRRLLVLDEPFRCVSREHAPRVRELVETLSRELKIQVVQVTHNQELACGKVIRLS